MPSNPTRARCDSRPRDAIAVSRMHAQHMQGSCALPGTEREKRRDARQTRDEPTQSPRCISGCHEPQPQPQPRPRPRPQLRHTRHSPNPPRASERPRGPPIAELEPRKVNPCLDSQGCVGRRDDWCTQTGHLTWPARPSPRLFTRLSNGHPGTRLAFSPYSCQEAALRGTRTVEVAAEWPAGLGYHPARRVHPLSPLSSSCARRTIAVRRRAIYRLRAWSVVVRRHARVSVGVRRRGSGLPPGRSRGRRVVADGGVQAARRAVAACRHRACVVRRDGWERVVGVDTHGRRLLWAGDADAGAESAGRCRGVCRRRGRVRRCGRVRGPCAGLRSGDGPRRRDRVVVA